MKHPKPVNWYRGLDGVVRVNMSDGQTLQRNPWKIELLEDGRTRQVRAVEHKASWGLDSGQVSAFRPAQHVKPHGFIRRVQRAWGRLIGGTDPAKTTQEGAPSAASPVTYYMSLWSQRFERRAQIEDCRELELSDCRLRRAIAMYVLEATRGGAHIHVQGEGRIAKKAAKVAEGIENLFPASLLRGWGRGLLLEGDLFIQFALNRKGELVRVLRMPGIAMERLTDDADQVIDPTAAFAQIDSMTFENVATFADWQISHTRWDHIDGDRYGTSEIIAIRRNQRMLELLEQSQAIRRMVRASRMLLHSVGNKDQSGSEQDIIDYKNRNGFVEGDQEPFDPMNAARDFFGNGQSSITPIEGDPNIDSIKDLLHFQNVVQCGYPTPGFLFGLDAESVNRDVVEDVMGLWLLSTVKLNEALNEPITRAFGLALQQAGIDIDLVDFQVKWSRSSLEKAGDVVEWIASAKAAGIISRKTAVQQIQEFTDVADVDAELAEIASEAPAPPPATSEFPPVPKTNGKHPSKLAPEYQTT